MEMNDPTLEKTRADSKVDRAARLGRENVFVVHTIQHHGGEISVSRLTRILKNDFYLGRTSAKSAERFTRRLLSNPLFVVYRSKMGYRGRPHDVVALRKEDSS